ncbi:MAG: GHMP family kinase ATP-binding protein [Anaerolineae bacterium]
MTHKQRAVASAPASIAVAGDTTDVSGKGGTLTLGIEGPNPTQPGGMRAYAMVMPGAGKATALRIQNTDEFTADTFFGASNLLQIAGYEDVAGIEISCFTRIPPGYGLGGSAAQLVALLGALDDFFDRQRPPEEMAEIVQRATLRPGQVHGYQKPYGSTYGGVRYYGFSHKLTGLWGKGVGGIIDEPYAIVSEARAQQWDALGVSLLIAVPADLSMVSGEVNAEIAGRYRLQDEATVKAMDRKTLIAQMAHQRLVSMDTHGFWLLVDQDTHVMEEWGLVSPAHKAIMAIAKEHGAYAAKPASTGGAVIVFCPSGEQSRMAEALQEVATEVYLASIAHGVRIEDEWPFVADQAPAALVGEAG